MLENPIMYGQQRDLSVDIGLGPDVGVTFHSSSEVLSVDCFGIVTVPEDVIDVTTVFVTVLDESGEQRAVVRFEVAPSDLDLDSYVADVNFESTTVISVTGAEEAQEASLNSIYSVSAFDNNDNTITVSWESTLNEQRLYRFDIEAIDELMGCSLVKSIELYYESPGSIVIEASDLDSGVYRVSVGDTADQVFEFSESFNFVNNNILSNLEMFENENNTVTLSWISSKIGLSSYNFWINDQDDNVIAKWDNVEAECFYNFDTSALQQGTYRLLMSDANYENYDIVGINFSYTELFDFNPPVESTVFDVLASQNEGVAVNLCWSSSVESEREYSVEIINSLGDIMNAEKELKVSSPESLMFLSVEMVDLDGNPLGSDYYTFKVTDVISGDFGESEPLVFSYRTLRNVEAFDNGDNTITVKWEGELDGMRDYTVDILDSEYNNVLSETFTMDSSASEFEGLSVRVDATVFYSGTYSVSITECENNVSSGELVNFAFQNTGDNVMEA